MERHSGRGEKTERFGGRTFHKECSCRSMPRAQQEKKTLMRRGLNVRIEREAPRRINVYKARPRK